MVTFQGKSIADGRAALIAVAVAAAFAFACTQLSSARSQFLRHVVQQCNVNAGIRRDKEGMMIQIRVLCLPTAHMTVEPKASRHSATHKVRFSLQVGGWCEVISKYELHSVCVV